MTDLVTKISSLQDEQHRAALLQFEELFRGFDRETLSEDEFRSGLIFISDLGRDVGEIEHGLDLREGAITEWIEESNPSTEQRRSLYYLMRAIIAELQDSLGVSSTATLPGRTGIGTVWEPSKEDAEILEHFTLPEGVTLDTKLNELHGWDDLPTRLKNCLRYANVEDVRSLLTISRTRKNWSRMQLFERLVFCQGLGRRSRQRLVGWLKGLGFKSKLLEHDSP